MFDVQHAALGIGMFVEGRTLSEFETDLMLRSAVERQFEIIGEALTRLRKSDPAVLQHISEATRIIGFRNVLIHGYDTVTNAITWDIVQKKLPILLVEIESLLGKV